ncbi:MAG: hypothetical protein ABI808_00775 [Pseudonocardiales bacterium]
MTYAATTPAVEQVASARSRYGWPAGVLVVATMGSLLIFHQVWADPAHLTLGGPRHTNDPMVATWNLKWVPWQLAHGHSPFSTNAIYYPGGVSLSWNTLIPTLGILAAPITFTLGPQVAYAVLMTLAPALAALSGFYWLRRHTTRPAAAALGGLVVGFNPFITGHLQGHLNLVFVALIPVMLMLFEDLLWRRPRPNARTAAYLGLVTAAQAGISEELILITALAMAIPLACSAVVFGRRLWELVQSSWPAMLGTLGVFLLAASPLLVSQLFLSKHVELHSAHWRATLGDYVVPMHGQLLDPNWTHFTYVGGAENGVYLGVVLLAVLVVGIITSARRDRRVRAAAATLAGLAVLTFGESRPLGLPLPWRALSHLPALTSILPVRFSFAAYLVVAWLLAHWLDALLITARGRWRTSPAVLVAMAAVVAAVVTIVPFQVGAGPVPANVSFFTTGQSQALFGRDVAILLLPAATFGDASGMYYQMQADFSFTQPGGYALRPENNHAEYGPPDSPLVRLAAAASLGRTQSEDVAAGRRQLAAEHYRGIVVVRDAPGSASLIRLAEQLTGRPADRATGGVEVWLLPVAR